MKMRRPHRVPLSRQVIAMLKELHEHTHWWKYLFPCLGKPRKAMRNAFDWSSSARPVIVRSSRGAEARLPSAVQTASFTSGVTGTFSAASSAAIQSAAQLRSLASSMFASGWSASASPSASAEPSA
jgi:hypothetical protein